MFGKLRIFFVILAAFLSGHRLSAEPGAASAAMMERAQQKLDAADFAGAETLFRNALAVSATNADAWRGLGRALYSSRQYRDALACFQKTTSLHPADATARLGIGACYYALGDFRLATESYGKFVETYADSPTGLEGLGKSLYKLKRYAEALGVLRKELAAAPQSGSAHYWVGCCLARLEQFDDAESELRTSIGFDPKQADSYDQLGYCLIHLGRYSDAIPVYNKAQAVGGPDGDRLFWMGCCHIKAGDYPQGRAFLREYVAQFPKDPDGHYWLANALYQLGNYDAARNALRKAILLDKNHLNARELLGDTLIALKSYDQAADAYAQAIRIKPDDFYAHLWRGRALMMDVQVREGVGELEKACQLAPKDGPARRLLVSGYLVTSQYRKAWQLYPGAYSSGVAALLIAFGAGSIVLLRKSVRPSTAAAPGLWFSLGWFAYFWDGQVMFIFLAGLFTSAFASMNVVAGMVLGPLPLLAASLTAFPKQPWGKPFSFPHDFSWKLLAAGCAGLVFVFLFDASYVTIVPALTHLAPGHPRNVPFIEQMMQTSPPLALLSVVILAPLAEEVLFRGLLFAALAERCGKWAILVSAIAFAAAHFDPYYFIPLVALGCLFGWTRWKSGTIWVSALMHMLNNAIAMSSM